MNSYEQQINRSRKLFEIIAGNFINNVKILIERIEVARTIED